MTPNITFSSWNIHGITNQVLGDKTKNNDFLNDISKNDFTFLTETWSNTDINIPGFKTFTSKTTAPKPNKFCRISGGISLLVTNKLEKYVTVVKQSKNTLWCKISKNVLNLNSNLYICGVYISPEKSRYFENEIFDELEKDIASFSSKGNIMLLGDFNARTGTLEDFISKDKNNLIHDTTENCLQPPKRQSFDNTINNHGKQLLGMLKATDLKIVNGRTTGDSLGRPTFHGAKGISICDYIICDQDLLQSINNFVVKPPSYLSDHSQIIAWVNIFNNKVDPTISNQSQPNIHKLPNQFIWSNETKESFKKSLKSPNIQIKYDEFLNSTYTLKVELIIVSQILKTLYLRHPKCH